MQDRRAQQAQAAALKRELNQRMAEERKQVQQTIREIDRLEHKTVDKALARQYDDSNFGSPKKKKVVRQFDSYSDRGGGGDAGW